MATCEWVILCDYAFRDEGRKTCIIGIFDRVFTRGVPSSHPQVALVMRLHGDAGERVPVRVEIARPTGAGLAKLQADVDLGQPGRSDVHMNFVGLPLPDFGTYSINVYFADELVRTALFVVATPPSSAAPS
jgi:hypothetical protein